MEVKMEKWLCILLMCVLAETAATAAVSSPSECQRDFRGFVYDLNSQCPFSNPFYSPPVQVDGESFEKIVSSSKKNSYIAVLFYASWCPFSSMFQSNFATLSSMYPQIEHLMVEQSSAMPSVFSRYGIHSVPALLILSHTTKERYHGQKDLESLIDFYKRTTGLSPAVNLVKETSRHPESGRPDHSLQFWNRSSLKETFSREPYLMLSVIFVLLRAFLYFCPEITSRLMTLWTTYIPRLNLAIFGESKQLLEHTLHLIDVKRIWSKLKVCQTRKFHKGARNARVWASSLASVSLGKTTSSSSRPAVTVAVASRDL
ncbi:5'-adenylylsulfate reductase-like 5 [Andrographis paniculata]|uniref:5'-adenylylsulfate reductase-like 5 n=1 Tax=Andrographis paniculata TaxID=175694 RepID=UPI0021E9779B|nr:5'-adenylylsulfate reductase-like 5 [Andrographis paniculata]